MLSNVLLKIWLQRTLILIFDEWTGQAFGLVLKWQTCGEYYLCKEYFFFNDHCQLLMEQP